jgi:RNA recognition motif-containing protein
MNNKRIHVGNLSFDSTDGDIRTAFEAFGTVHDVALIMDHATGRSRGFGFVVMDDTGGCTAIEQLNGKDLGGRAITVNEAHPRATGSTRHLRVVPVSIALEAEPVLIELEAEPALITAEKE